MNPDEMRNLFETVAAFIVALTIIAAAVWRLIKPHVRDFVRSVKDVEHQVTPNGNRSRDSEGHPVDHTAWSLHDLASEAKVDASQAKRNAAEAKEAAGRVAGQLNVLMEVGEANNEGIHEVTKRVDGLAEKADDIASDLTVTSSTVVETQHDVVAVKEALADHVAEGERFLEGALHQLAEQGIHLSSHPTPDPTDDQES